MARFMVAGMSAAVLAAGSPVAAQDEVISRLQECRQIADVQERLACYDALAEKFRRATDESAEKTGSEPASAPGDEGIAAESAAPGDRPKVEKPPREPGSPTGQQAGPKPDAPTGKQGRPEPASGVASDAPEAEGAGPRESQPESITSAEDLSLPYRTRIDSFASNRRGDYRFRIGEGIVFERAGGPGVPAADLTGAAVTLSKNFLGQWRADVEGQPRELWISPIRR